MMMRENGRERASEGTLRGEGYDLRVWSFFLFFFVKHHMHHLHGMAA